MGGKQRAFSVDVPKLLVELGIDVRRSAGGEARGYCPSRKHQADPTSSAATRTGPGSWQIHLEGPKAGLHHCYSGGCGFGGGPVALVQEAKGFATRKEARRWLAEFAGFELPKGASTGYERKARAERIAGPLRYPKGTVALWREIPPELVPARAYVLERRGGFLEDELKRFAVGATPEEAPEYPGRIIVPVVVDSKMVDFVARLWVERPKHVPKALSGRRAEGALKEYAIWGYDDLDPTIPFVVLTEGIWGANALRRAGVPNVGSICGSAWSDERTELLGPWPRVVLVPDRDEAGSQLADRASSLRFGHDVYVADLSPYAQPDDAPLEERAGLVASAKPAAFGGLPHVSLQDWTRKQKQR